MEGLLSGTHQLSKQQRLSPQKSLGTASHLSNKQNQVGSVLLYGIPIVSLVIDSQERLCLAQISNTLLKQYSYNEIHNRRVALGITCVQCTPVQLEILRRAGAMPVSSRRCGMITRREAERLCKSFLGDNAPPRLPDDFAFSVHHECAWGCRGAFLPSRYNSSRAKCIKCTFCGLFFSPNKFIFHSHRTSPSATYVQPDAANFNSWRRHMKLSGSPPDDVIHAWEDVKAMFNGGTRKRLLASTSGSGPLPVRPTMSATVPVAMSAGPDKRIKMDTSTSTNSPYPTPSNTPISVPTSPRVPPFPDLSLPISMMDYVWHNGVNVDGIKHQFPFAPYAVPWFGTTKRSVLGLSTLSSVSPQQESLLQQLCPGNNSEKMYHHSAFRPVFPGFGRPDILIPPDNVQNNSNKRQSDGEESVSNKRKCSKDLERSGLGSGNEDFDGGKANACRSVADNPRWESVDKENESRKNSGGGEPRECYSEEFKTTFKKESASEASNDTDETQKKTSKTRNPQIGNDLIEVSRFLSIKPNILEESVLKFREFSPNLLEAISCLKAEDRGVYAGLSVKMYQDLAAEAERRDGNAGEDYGARTAFEGEDEESRSGSRTEEDEDDDDDEPVDVETTDDFPPGEASLCTSQDRFEGERHEKLIRVETNEEDRPSRIAPEVEKSSRIWTIARFSVEEPAPDSIGPQTSGFCCSSERGIFCKNRRETDICKGNASDHKKQKSSDGECFCCRQVALGNG